MAQRVNYSAYKATEFTCPDCSWTGLGEEACLNFEMVMDLECPKCFKMLAIIDAPTYGEILHKGKECDRERLKQEIKFKENFQRVCLKSADQLPDIKGDSISFTFRSDTIDGEDLNIIEHQDQTIWQEPMLFEGYERFMEIGNLMKEKYGVRMVDLIPDQTAELFLYGDKLKAPAIIAAYRISLKKSSG
ncbi:hypothetical protein I5M27_08715 [Adhaeribacter sp. BT258]|uniref:Uncharacterized protein n=1 Tax=Adhaeribacter terrigena TaxID=2793070 RepID=A0ABS1C119_9BACT|nr:hypothetical protein [Adhaeribacter terrigena]MBK0403067.1 hypothetical protein [Adhaeribacter terrigena]